MDAFFLIDKPLWISSFDVIRELRKKTQFRKIGHTWTLDPLATGLLLVAFWNYTKLIPYFEKDKKTYEFGISFEGTTASLDSETELISAWEESYERLKNNFNAEYFQNILLKSFHWEIEQIPPKYSALKIDGKKALDKVRSWEVFEMKKRKATIYNIEILSLDFPKLILKATVSAGTYVRTIAWDLWDIVWTGGYVTVLRRTEIGKLWLNLSQSLDDFDPEKFLPVEHILWEYETLTLNEETMTRLNHWQRVRNVFSIKPWEYFIKDATHVTHIIEVDEDILKMKKRIM
jgi:tRNA pseudouridine55 synthase